MLEPAVAGRIVVSTNEDALAVLRRKSMRQALYDAGAPVMADCLLDLHAEAHRDRRRLENRLFRRATFEHFERDRPAGRDRQHPRPGDRGGIGGSDRDRLSHGDAPHGDDRRASTYPPTPSPSSSS